LYKRQPAHQNGTIFRYLQLSVFLDLSATVMVLYKRQPAHQNGTIFR